MVECAFGLGSALCSGKHTGAEGHGQGQAMPDSAGNPQPAGQKFPGTNMQPRLLLWVQKCSIELSSLGSGLTTSTKEPGQTGTVQSSDGNLASGQCRPAKV